MREKSPSIMSKSVYDWIKLISSKIFIITEIPSSPFPVVAF